MRALFIIFISVDLVRRIKRCPVSTAESRQLALHQWIEQLQGFSCENLTLISGDASFRRYFRFSSDGKSFIAVDAPPKFEDAQRFIDVANAYQSLGIDVPVIHAANFEDGFYVQEDLGDELFSTALTNENTLSIYRDALALLPKVQSTLR